MAVIRSGSSVNQLDIDAVSNAARVTLYNPDGSLQLPAVKASYLAFSPAFTPGATPQDVFSITGSATKLVRVLSMSLHSVQGSSGINGWQLVRRSTANTGGTSASVTPIRSDLNDPAVTATVLQYTANSTAGTLVGTAWSGFIGASAIGSAAAQYLDVLFVETLGKSVILRSVNDVLAWSFGGLALPSGLSIRCGVRFTEE